jgi:hypothetical protein
MNCSIPECPEPVFNKKRELCRRHLQQLYRKNASAESRANNLAWQRKRYQEHKNDPEFIEKRRVRTVASGRAEWRSALRTRRSELIDAIKNVPCVDCDQKFPPICMDFDHVPERGEKSFSISQRCYTGSSWELILEEIAKCEIVCSNCHRMRTEVRRTAEKDLIDRSIITESV